MFTGVLPVFVKEMRTKTALAALRNFKQDFKRSS
jgi:hypothetical protein